MLVSSTSALAAPNNRMLRRWSRVQHQSTQLTFVHIPKTAGTAIENAAAEVGVKWGIVAELMLWESANCTIRSIRKGVCPSRSAATRLRSPRNGWTAGSCEHHLTYECDQPSCRGCPSASYAGSAPFMTPFEAGRIPSCSLRGVSAAAADEQTRLEYEQNCCYWWHLPPPLLRHDPRPALRTPHRFCVVRNPYTRLLSAYRNQWNRPVECKSEYFATNLSGHVIAQHRKQSTSIAAFNPPSLSAWVRLMDVGFTWADERTPRESWGRVSNASSPWSAHPASCWFEPQSAYLAQKWASVGDLRGETIHDAGEPARVAPSDRGCNIVLRYENLADEFAALMKWAQLNISLPERRKVGFNPSSARVKSSVASPPPSAVDSGCLSPSGAQALLTDDALAIVRRRWQDDFRVLGYSP